jgi:pimeloyl-ACP methyl ester carboxylesterase
MTPRRPNDDDTIVQHGWQSHFIASDEGLSLHCRVLGAGNRTCLLIHGYGDNGNIWTTFARARSANHAGW